MVIVITVMSLAAVLAWAILSGTALQAQASTNGINAAIADAQAESGVHLAMYYLLNPANSPVNLASATPVSLGNQIKFASTTQPSQPIPGSCSVTVTQTGANRYLVSSVGSSAGSAFGGGVVSRSVAAQVQVNTAYTIKQAATFNSAVTVVSGISISGTPDAIRSSQTVTISGGSVSGNIRAPGSGLPGPAVPPAPTAADLNDYSKAYTYQGVSYTPTKLATSMLNNTTMGPTAGNPLGVYWYSGDVYLQGNVTISGTLTVKNGNLWLWGKNNTITAQPMMPAVIIDKQLDANLASTTGLTANGILYAGTGLKGVGSSPKVNLVVNGALLINSGGISNFLGTINVNYNAATANAPNLSSVNQTPVGVQITSWVQ